MKKIELNRVYFGDCLDIMEKIEDNSIDAIITDPPYGTTKCKWDSIIPFDKMWKQLKRIRKDNTPIALFGIEPFSSCLRLSNINEFKYDWVWNKVKPNGHLVANIRPMQQTEIISVFGKGKINYYPLMTERDKYRKDVNVEYSRSEIVGGNITKEKKKIIRKYKYPTNLIVSSNASNKDRLHPTQKPIKLLEYLILTYTKIGDIVLDFTSGSGSTGVACQNLKRNFILIENEKKYYEISNKRIISNKKFF